VLIRRNRPSTDQMLYMGQILGGGKGIVIVQFLIYTLKESESVS